MTEASYTAWDDKQYVWPPPDGWYQAFDGKWWPEGYGPPEAAPTPAPVEQPTDEQAAAEQPTVQHRAVEEPAVEEVTPEKEHSAPGSFGGWTFEDGTGGPVEDATATGFDRFDGSAHPPAEAPDQGADAAGFGAWEAPQSEAAPSAITSPAGDSGLGLGLADDVSGGASAAPTSDPAPVADPRTDEGLVWGSDRDPTESEVGSQAAVPAALSGDASAASLAVPDALSGDALSGDALSGDALSGDELSGDESAPVPAELSAAVPAELSAAVPAVSPAADRQDILAADSPRSSRGLLFVLLGAVALLAIGAALYVTLGDDEGPDADGEVARTGPGSVDEPHPRATRVAVFYPDGDVERRWIIEVIEPVRDVSAEVGDGNGTDVVLATRVRVTNDAALEPGNLSDLSFDIVDGTQVTVRTDNQCPPGVEDFDYTASVAVGESVDGVMCWVLPATDSADLKLGVESSKVQGRVHILLQ